MLTYNVMKNMVFVVFINSKYINCVLVFFNYIQNKIVKGNWIITLYFSCVYFTWFRLNLILVQLVSVSFCCSFSC